MSDQQWQELSQRLRALGWIPHTAEGIVGLLSPHDTMFIDARAASGNGRKDMIASLNQRIATILEYKAQGHYPLEAQRALEDSRQAIDCLEQTDK